MDTNTGNEASPGNDMSVNMDEVLDNKQSDFSNAGMIGRHTDNNLTTPKATS